MKIILLLTLLSNITYADTYIDRVCGLENIETTVTGPLLKMDLKKLDNSKVEMDMVTINGHLYHIRTTVLVDKKYENVVRVSVILGFESPGLLYQLRYVYKNDQLIWNRVIEKNKFTNCFEGHREKLKL